MAGAFHYELIEEVFAGKLWLIQHQIKVPVNEPDTDCKLVVGTVWARVRFVVARTPNFGRANTTFNLSNLRVIAMNLSVKNLRYSSARVTLKRDRAHENSARVIRFQVTQRVA
jgi:hypothetical protein